MRPSLRRTGFVLASLCGVLLLAWLGIWQLERRAWKLGLIAQVERQLHAAPVEAPGPATWHAPEPYQPVTLRGHWIAGKDTLALAVTGHGRGYWVISPLRSDRGFTVLVNRGFVPAEKRDANSRPALTDAPVELHGLLRSSEPEGGFLRKNDPANDRWYARDVAAIATARGLTDVAPYFIDAAAGPQRDALPIGGLTVIHFRNDHLVYALTWFALAIGVAAASLYVLRKGRSG